MGEIRKVDETRQAIEKLVLAGDMSRLSPEQKVQYYNAVCSAAGLNPALQPFGYMRLQGKETLYAKKACTDQLRQVHGLSARIVERERGEDGIYRVTAVVKSPDGREEEDDGRVNVKGLQGDALCNAEMKCITKAKRRATLAFCGIPFSDETEVETIPRVQVVEPPQRAALQPPEIKGLEELYHSMKEEMEQAKDYGALLAVATRIGQESGWPGDLRALLRKSYAENVARLKHAS